MPEEKAVYLLALLMVLSYDYELRNYGYLRIKLTKTTLDELLLLDNIHPLRKMKRSILMNLLVVLSYIFRKTIEVI